MNLEENSLPPKFNKLTDSHKTEKRKKEAYVQVFTLNLFIINFVLQDTI